MKAVDPVAIQDSFPGSNVILPNTMVPKVDTTNSVSVEKSDTNFGNKDFVTSPSLKSSPTNSPTKEIPIQALNNYVNGSDITGQYGFGNGDSPVKINGLLTNGSSQNEDSPRSPCNSFNHTPINRDETSEFQNGVREHMFQKENENFIGVNVTVHNGFYKGEDEHSNGKHSLESLTDVEVNVNGSKRSSSPPENIPRVGGGYSALAVDSGLESAASSWDRALGEGRDHEVARLQDELRSAREELKLKDEEVERLSRIRQEVESELEELTASLFQEAHNMVREARERQAAAEKSVHERGLQVEVLTAEVAALKTLVLTSTPSRPNPHLHPQIDPKAKDDANTTGNALFRKHRRSPSHFNLKYGRENSPPETPTKDSKPQTPSSEPSVEIRDGIEVDPVLHREFLAWKQNPTTEQTDPFITRIYQEDINSCLSFSNTQLAAQVQAAVQSGNIFIEAVNEKSRTHFPKKCALLEAPRLCQYRMRLGEDDTWYSISQICRNRIIAVCDFLNYLNYIQRGLVKSSVSDVYWEVVRLRKEMVLARLGLPLST